MTRRRHPAVAGALVASTIVLAGCGSSDSRTSDSAAATTQPGGSTTVSDGVQGDGDDAIVTVSGFSFQPEPLEAEVGQEVVWENDDKVRHTATGDDGSFDLDLDGASSSGRRTFTEAGTYDYICTVHESMTGRIVVK